MTERTEWVAVDWGTSNLRAWGLTANGTATFATTSPKGMGKLGPDEFAGVLVELLEAEGINPGTKLDVLICGMAGARQGWLEAPYLDAPADLRGLARGAVRPEVQGSQMSVSILPGVCQKANGEENVMRGEETQLLGLASIMSGYAGVVCMPGTHSKWAELDGLKLTRFTTAMTGELHEVLSNHSILQHSLSGAPDGPERETGFSEGLDAGIAQPDRLSSQLFTVRAASLLSGRQADWCSGYLSGLLIGSEVGARADLIGDDAAIPVIGSPKLCALYGEALHRIGATGRIIDSSEVVLAGLLAARSH